MKRSDFTFWHPFRIRYSEIDGQMVVFNAHYLTFFDTAITEYFRELDHDITGEARETGIDFHTVKSLVEYKAPVVFDQEIDVAVRTGRIGRSSLSFDLAIFGKGTDDLYTTGEIVWVYTDQRTHKTVPVGEALRQVLIEREPHLSEALAGA
ncbi:acyl-CoA thioesterase [Chelatococcus reniformis]|uniref:4-hydroxybenzoyl-CoA thioesterase n=1 Tax=Chelatococcus reniformis TaxID=1494448 RepID=A0A916X9J1_9HYPH|nr:thioesterase family protein [Chelatococcus reniformis]GGC54901.1 putative 4-hydroxybenzoyl-CoA thioesterase [Chelatococcus reniformis]